MLTISDRVRNQRIRVVDSRRLGVVDHGVGVVLLCARVGVGKQSVDAVHSGQLDAWLVGKDVSVADQLG